MKERSGRGNACYFHVRTQKNLFGVSSVSWPFIFTALHSLGRHKGKIRPNIEIEGCLKLACVFQASHPTDSCKHSQAAGHHAQLDSNSLWSMSYWDWSRFMHTKGTNKDGTCTCTQFFFCPGKWRKRLICPPFGGHTNIASDCCRLRCVIPTSFGTWRAPRQRFWANSPARWRHSSTRNNVKKTVIFCLTHASSLTAFILNPSKKKDSRCRLPTQNPPHVYNPHQTLLISSFHFMICSKSFLVKVILGCSGSTSPLHCNLCFSSPSTNQTSGPLRDVTSFKNLWCIQRLHLTPLESKMVNFGTRLRPSLARKLETKIFRPQFIGKNWKIAWIFMAFFFFHGSLECVATYCSRRSIRDLSMVEMMDSLESCISVKIKEMVHGKKSILSLGNCHISPQESRNVTICLKEKCILKDSSTRIGESIVILSLLNRLSATFRDKANGPNGSGRISEAPIGGPKESSSARCSS